MKRIIFLLLITLNLMFGQAEVDVREPSVYVDGFEISCYLEWHTSLANDYTELLSQTIWFEGDDYPPFYSEVNINGHLLMENLSPDTWYRYGVSALCFVLLPFPGENHTYFGDIAFQTPKVFPNSTTATDITENGFTAKWMEFNGSTDYRIDVDDNIDFSSPLENYNNLNVGNVTSKEITGLSANTTYYYRIRAFSDELSSTTDYSNVITTKTLSSFSITSIPILGGYAAWGDYDNDGDLDILSSTALFPVMILKNNSGQFTGVELDQISLDRGDVAWGDYDNDGDLDILLSGSDSYGKEYISRIYRNNNGTFTDIIAGLIGVTYSNIEWGDYDNDGDLDIFLSGETVTGEYISVIYRNDNGTFTDINAQLTAIRTNAVSWADYDNDSDLDIFLSGETVTGEYVSVIYRNDNGTFTDINAQLLYSILGADWGDYDNDGDLDLLVSGMDIDLNRYAKIFRNDSGVFADINAGLFGLISQVVWIDHDNDGDLDILLAGYNRNDPEPNENSRFYKNESGEFIEIDFDSGDNHIRSAEVGDYDNDGDLDIMTTWFNDGCIYINNTQTPNTPPSSPSNLTSSSLGNDVTLSWDKGFDNETPQNGLSYNLYIGTEPQSSDINTPMSDIETGYRRVVELGNTAQNTSWTIKDLPNGIYYWSVQAVDHAFAGSEFAEEQNFTVSSPTPIAFNASNVTSFTFTANWSSTSNIIGYKITVDENMDFSSPLDNYNDLDVNNNRSYLIEGLNTNTTYYYRIRSYDISGIHYESNVITVKTLLSSPTATEANGITITSFFSNWIPFDGAEGYIIDVDDNIDFSSPLPRYNNLDVGNEVNFQITDLKINTEYYYRVKYYADGNSFDYSNRIATKTLSSFSITSIPILGGYAAWGDYDNDGDLDILSSTALFPVIILKNNSGQFTGVELDQISLDRGDVAWGDYDNDGDLDILLSGSDSYGKEYISRIYRNNNGTFTDIIAGLIGVTNSNIEWGDYDNDGDLDIFLSGETVTGEYISVIYRNDNGSFTDTNAQLTAIRTNAVSWADYDNDSDLDIFLSGETVTGEYISVIYRNDNGTFTDINAQLLYSILGADWGDYDNDGDLDLLVSGMDINLNRYAKIFRNDSGVFTDINAGLFGLISQVVWLDHDNDGDLDILLAGHNSNYPEPDENSRFYRNESGEFIEIDFDSGDNHIKSAEVGDYDNDGDLDIMTTWFNDGCIYINNTQTPNTPPSSPSNLTSSSLGNDVTLSWDKGFDNETPQNGLSYNLYIGTEPQSSDINTPMSDIETGYRKVVELGNANQNTSWAIKDLPDGIYYWSVQAVDNAFAGSEFAGENTFVKGDYILPENSIVTMDKNSEFRVLEGANFTAHNSQIILDSGLDIETEKWKGIIAESESFVDLNNVNITGAETGVSGIGNFKFDITNSTFESCNNGINLIAIQSGYAYSITDNTIIGVDNGRGVSITESEGTFNRNNVSHFDIGVSFISCSPTVSKNEISYNKYYGITVRGTGAIPQLINTEQTQVYGELNNTIQKNAYVSNTSVNPSAQIGISPYANVYMRFNDVISSPTRLGISIANVLGYADQNLVISAQYNFWGSEFVNDDYFFDNHPHYTIDYSNFLPGPCGTISMNPSDAQSSLPTESKILSNAFSLERKENYTAAIKLYEHIIEKYEDTPEYYVAMARLPYLYAQEGLDNGKLIDTYDEAYASENTTNKKFFKGMKVSTHIKGKRYDEAIKVAEEMKAEAEFEEEIILADISIAIANMEKNAESKNKNYSDHLAKISDLLDKLDGFEDNGDKVETEDVIESHLPSEFILYQNYPNPFNPVTQIKFALPTAGSVKLNVYNINGQLVSELLNGNKEAGIHTVSFDGSNLNSGMYFYTLEANGICVTKKMVLTK